MIIKRITYFGAPAAVGCDANCAKAWGYNSRPKIEFDADDPDDVAYLADGELGIAPDDPGTYEGGHAKPTAYKDGQDHRLNKWCVRECERCGITARDSQEITELPTFNERVYNQPWKHQGQGA